MNESQTLNELRHPLGAYLLSANIKAETIKGWLLDTIAKLEARAREILAGRMFDFLQVSKSLNAQPDKSKIKHRSAADRDKIFAICEDIVKNGFKFSLAMIDKSGSELKALLEGGPFLTVFLRRLSDFHFFLSL